MVIKLVFSWFAAIVGLVPLQPIYLRPRSMKYQPESKPDMKILQNLLQGNYLRKCFPGWLPLM